MTQEQVFKALSDNTRRDIFDMIMQHGSSLSVSEITENFKMTRQAISKHIEVLVQAGLLDCVHKGRERFCYADPKPLMEIYKWLSKYEKQWKR